MNKRIVLCADDYGQEEAISEGILALVAQSRLSAVSCMVTGKAWEKYAKLLLFYSKKVDIGLHFSLTEGQPLSSEFLKFYGKEFFSLKSLLIKAHLQTLSREHIRAECLAQILHFKKTMGFAPDFIDGHQHVHQFPVIKDCIVDCYQAGQLHRNVYFRLCKGLNWNTLKNGILNIGGYFFEKTLSKNNMFFNQSFEGVYPFSQVKHYSKFFPRFLNKIKEKGIIMCHPGEPAPSKSKDPLKEVRYQEYCYLRSELFQVHCEHQKVKLSRFFDQG